MDYTSPMLDIVQSETFARWLGKLKDRMAVARINARIRRLSETRNFGDAKPVREGVSEMRIDHGPGYRVYFSRQGQVLVLVLCGSDKSEQSREITRAIAYLNDWKERGKP